MEQNYFTITIGPMYVMRRRGRRRACRMASGRWDTDIDSSATSQAEPDPDDWRTSDPCTRDTTSADSGRCGMATACLCRRHNVATA